jgi:hypothetical protein
VFSMAYHPQTDGKIERVNKVIEDVLCMHVMGKPSYPSSGKNIYLW